MTDPRELLARYLEQRWALGETSYTFSSEGEAVELMASPNTQAPAQQPGPVRADGAEQWRKGAPDIPGPGIDIPVPPTDLFVGDPLADKDLDQLGELIRACDQCALCGERTNAVPGEGPAHADLMVVGEGPGAKEDQQGRPFVGRAGELLNDILAAIDCPRPTVFIANVVKCRPPGNRNPEGEEIAACLPYLYRQIAVIQPKVILAMGAVAAQALLEVRGPLSSMRNKVHRFRGIPLVVTYHPAALLRNPNWKKPTWDDVRIARRLLAGER